MIFGLKINQQEELVDGLIDEWNEIFKEPVRNIISETKYYKNNEHLKLPSNNYIMAIKPIFPVVMWISILGLGAIGSAVFGYFKLAVILATLLLVMFLFFSPILYILGTKYRLKRNGYKGKVKYVRPSEVLREIVLASEVQE